MLSKTSAAPEVGRIRTAAVTISNVNTTPLFSDPMDVCRYQRRHLPRPTRFHYVRICGIDPSLSPRSQEQSDAKADGIRRRSPYRAFVRGGRDDKWEENDDAGRAHLLSKRKPPQCNLSPAASRVPEEESSMGSAATCTIANWRPLHWVRIGLTARWSGPAL